MSLFDELNSLNDLNDLIERKIRESDILEYKTASDQIQPNEKDAASKALSAFANTSGGVLIYGMATRDPKDPERPTAIESISARTASHLLKHAEEGVRHPIPGVRKKPIAAEDDRQVLLFDVPPSPIAPHQLASDKVYYRRENAHSVPMSHDLVELYFGRRLHPRLQPIIESSEKPDPNADRRVISRVVLSLVNLGGQLGREVLTRIVWLPNRALWLSVERVIVGTHHFDESKSAEGNVVSVPHHGELYYPGVPKEVVTINFNSSLDTIGSDKSIFFLDVYAADSRPYRYSFYRTFQEDAEWKVRWEAAGLPPFAA